MRLGIRLSGGAVAGALMIGGISIAAAEVPAPQIAIATNEELPTPLPYPYDESADAMALVDAALARASQNGKRVLLDLGGNWCPWCRILAGVMELPEVKPLIEAHFEVVSIDVSSEQGKIDRNLEVPHRFNTTEIGGVPWMIVLAPDGTVLHSSYEVTDQNHETPQAMVDWLASWAE